MPSIWGSPKRLDKLEIERDVKRGKSGRLTFNCFSARVKGDRVYCVKGHTLSSMSKDGSMQLRAVLRGRTSSICKACEVFDG